MSAVPVSHDAALRPADASPPLLRPSPLLLGHRGSPQACPENTLAGFQAARSAGLDGVEFDVRRLADGTLVVHHDEHLPDGRALTTLGRGECPAEVPSLDRVLAWASDTGAYLNIEWKYEVAQPDARVADTLRLVVAYGLVRQVIVSSFNPLLLRAAREQQPQIERGLLIHRRYRAGGLDAVPAVMRWLDAAALHPHHSLVDPLLMAQARSRGWRVNAWTVNEEAEVQRLSDLGIDALIGDLPEVLLPARA